MRYGLRTDGFWCWFSKRKHVLDLYAEGDNWEWFPSFIPRDGHEINKTGLMHLLQFLFGRVWPTWHFDSQCKLLLNKLIKTRQCRSRYKKKIYFYILFENPQDITSFRKVKDGSTSTDLEQGVSILNLKRLLKKSLILLEVWKCSNFKLILIFNQPVSRLWGLLRYINLTEPLQRL